MTDSGSNESVPQLSEAELEAFGEEISAELDEFLPDTGKDVDAVELREQNRIDGDSE